MEESTIWWLLAGGLVVAELLTGTFICSCWPWAWVRRALQPIWAHRPRVQILTAALVGGGSVVGWHAPAAQAPRRSICQG